MLDPLLFGSAVGLSLLPQGHRTLTDALGFLELAELLLRLRHRPAFGGPAERLLDLLAGDREAQRVVSIASGAVLAGSVLTIADARCDGNPIGCHVAPLSRLVPSLSLALR